MHCTFQLKRDHGTRQAPSLFLNLSFLICLAKVHLRTYWLVVSEFLPADCYCACLGSCSLDFYDISCEKAVLEPIRLVPPHKKYVSLKWHTDLHRGGIYKVRVFILILACLGYISDWHGITLKEVALAAFSHIFFIFYNRKPLRYTYFKYSLFTTTKILNSYFISQ